MRNYNVHNMQPSGRPHFLIPHLVYVIIYKVAYKTKPKENLKCNLKKIKVVEKCNKGHYLQNSSYRNKVNKQLP